MNLHRRTYHIHSQCCWRSIGGHQWSEEAGRGWNGGWIKQGTRMCVFYTCSEKIIAVELSFSFLYLLCVFSLLFDFSHFSFDTCGFSSSVPFAYCSLCNSFAQTMHRLPRNYKRPRRTYPPQQRKFQRSKKSESALWRVSSWFFLLVTVDWATLFLMHMCNELVVLYMLVGNPFFVIWFFSFF